MSKYIVFAKIQAVVERDTYMEFCNIYIHVNSNQKYKR